MQAIDRRFILCQACSFSQIASRPPQKPQKRPFRPVWDKLTTKRDEWKRQRHGGIVSSADPHGLTPHMRVVCLWILAGSMWGRPRRAILVRFAPKTKVNER